MSMINLIRIFLLFGMWLIEWLSNLQSEAEKVVVVFVCLLANRASVFIQSVLVCKRSAFYSKSSCNPLYPIAMQPHN